MGTVGKLGPTTKTVFQVPLTKFNSENGSRNENGFFIKVSPRTMNPAKMCPATNIVFRYHVMGLEAKIRVPVKLGPATKMGLSAKTVLRSLAWCQSASFRLDLLCRSTKNAGDEETQTSQLVSHGLERADVTFLWA